MGLNPLLTLAAIFGGLIILFQPLLGIYVVLMMSPLKTLGSQVIQFAHFAGMLTVAVVFLSLLGRRKKIIWTGLEGPVLVMGAGIAFSFFRTSNMGAVYDTLLSLTSLYGLVLVIVNLINTEKQLLAVMLVYMASGIYPIIQAFNQRAAGPSYVGQEFVRVSGTFTLATGLGGFLIPYTLIALALILYPGLPRLARLFVIGVFAAGYVALIFTVSRGAFASTLLGFGLLLYLLRDILRKHGLLLFFLAVVIVAFITEQYWSSVQGRLVTPVVNFISSGTSQDSNVLARDEELRLLIPITLDNHFMGTGIGNYSRNAIRYRYIYNAPVLPNAPHNILLYIFGEVGIVMAVGFFWMFGSIFKRIYSSHVTMKEKTQSIIFYVYASSSAALVGYSIFMITHSGLFMNDLWISMALLIVSIRLSKTAEEQGLPVAKRQVPRSWQIMQNAKTRL